MSILDTPTKDLPNVDRELDMIKVCTYEVKSSSTIFSGSVRAIYNRIKFAKKYCFVLNLYLPGINKSIFP